MWGIKQNIHHPLAYPVQTRKAWVRKVANITYLEDPLETEALYEKLCPPVRNWFKNKFPDFTDPQKLAIPSIMNGDHLLLCSPTGSGKTLTAFLTIIDKLVREALDLSLIHI